MSPDGPEQAEIQQRLRYVGRVQGVGFRYTTASIAKQYPVDGYVKNLSDGSVELVVSGAKKQVEAFLRHLAEHFERNIEHSTADDIQLAEPINGFHVRY